jgi:hypothetical protein
MEWNKMEQKRINISFRCFDILERRGTKLKVSGGMRRNSFNHISFYSIIIFQIKTINIILFHPFSFHSILFHQSIYSPNH